MHLTVSACAPGSIGNVGPGLDILGLAVAGPVDTVTLAVVDGTGIRITDPGHPQLPTDPAEHAAAISAGAVFRATGFRHGVTLSMHKGLPLSGGQGGSAASAVAGAVAANRLCDGGLDHNALLRCALIAEERVAGRHADNLGPSLLGGFVLIQSLDPLVVVELPAPEALRLVLVQPDQQLRTRQARGVLPALVSRDIALHQAAAVGAMIAAGCANDARAFGAAIDDRIAEPVRAPLLPGFIAARRAALDAGAFGCSISGAGPTAFALTDDDAAAAAIGDAMIAAYAKAGRSATARVTRVDHVGARVL